MIDNTANIDSIDMILADDSPNISNREVSSESVISLKRKCCYDEVSLSEQIKRFKITSTPGELRLQKDLRELELCGRIGISLQYPDQTGGVTIEFLDSVRFAPSLFRISVPRYYPHNHPIVFCLNGGFSCPFILPTGEITHSSIREEWSAIGTLGTVVDILQSIRLMFHNTIPPELTHGGSCLDISDEIVEDMKHDHGIYLAETILSGQQL